MDSISEPEHIEWYHESMFATNFTIYTRYKNKSYKSTCIKSVMIESSIVIKNAMESEDTNVFYVPDNNEIEPNAFKSILTFIHISKVIFRIWIAAKCFTWTVFVYANVIWQAPP